MSLGFGFSLPAATWNGGSALSSDPSLYMDYTVGSSGVPGVQPGYYLVDDVSGNLTQTTFSSLITFSRASNATRFSPTGQLQYAPHNLLLQSQDFATTWNNSNTTETTDTAVAPDGTTTADTLDDGTSTAAHEISQGFSITSGTTYTLSAFFKNIDRQYVILACSTGMNSWASAKFDLVAGAVGATSASGGGWSTTSSSITNVGNGWYRCTITFVPGTTALSGVRLGMATDGTTFSAGLRGLELYTGTNKQIYIWGAQLAVGPNALDYTPTTTAVVYGPRFDYDPTTLEAKGPLIEEQRTNILLYSEQFDNAYWTKNASTVTANAVTAPDGTLTGYKIIADITNANHTVFRSISFTSGTVYTVSCYAKAGEYDYFTLSAGSIATWPARVTFNLISGTVASTVAGTGSIQNIGNGWYRCSVSATATATAATGVNFAVSSTGSYVAYTGDGTSGIYIWGAQLEAGAFATSYIPTTTAATTRSADIASIGTLSPWYNASQGTFFAEFNTAVTTSGANIWETQQTLTSNERVEVGVSSAGVFNPRVVSGGVATVSLSVSTYSFGTTGKIAFAIQPANYAASFNAATPVTSSDADAPTIQELLYLGCRNGNSVFLNGHLRRITYTPRRLTDAELQSLTS